MLYLIGGSARAGKSILSLKLVRKKPMPCVPTDALVHLIYGGAPEKGIHYRTPVAERVKLFEPFLLGMIPALAWAWEDSVIEGNLVVPRHVTKLRSKDIPVAACFIGRLSIVEEEIVNYEGLNAWFSKFDAEERGAMLKRIVKRSRYLQRECDKRDIPFIDMSGGPYRTQQKLALEALLAQS